jgi:hypothetical protein
MKRPSRAALGPRSTAGRTSRLDRFAVPPPPRSDNEHPSPGCRTAKPSDSPPRASRYALTAAPVRVSWWPADDSVVGCGLGITDPTESAGRAHCPLPSSLSVARLGRERPAPRRGQAVARAPREATRRAEANRQPSSLRPGGGKLSARLFASVERAPPAPRRAPVLRSVAFLHSSRSRFVTAGRVRGPARSLRTSCRSARSLHGSGRSAPSRDASISLQALPSRRLFPLTARLVGHCV